MNCRECGAPSTKTPVWWGPACDRCIEAWREKKEDKEAAFWERNRREILEDMRRL